MEFLIEEKTFDLEVMKSLHSLENDFCLFEFEVSGDESLFTESFADFKNKVINALQKIIEAIKKFFESLATQMHIKFQQINMNNKLKEVKDLLAKKRSKAVNKKINYFDIKKYKAYYTDFINKYTSEIIKGYNKDFKDIAEYEAWRAEMLSRLSEFNYTLTDDEQWRLSIAINGAVQLSEEEVKNRDNNLKMVRECTDNSIKKIEKHYEHIDIENSYVNYDGKHLTMLKLKNSFIVTVCEKIANAVKTVAKFICKHTIGCILAVLALLIAL